MILKENLLNTFKTNRENPLFITLSNKKYNELDTHAEFLFVGYMPETSVEFVDLSDIETIEYTSELSILNASNNIARKTLRSRGNKFYVNKNYILIWYKNNTIDADAPIQVINDKIYLNKNYKDYFIKLDGDFDINENYVVKSMLERIYD